MDMVAGQVNRDGTLNSVAGDFTVTVEEDAGEYGTYYIDVPGENYVLVASPCGGGRPCYVSMVGSSKFEVNVSFGGVVAGATVFNFIAVKS